MTDTQIRHSTRESVADLEALYAAAFPDEDLLPLVRALERAEKVAVGVSARDSGGEAGYLQEKLVGHLFLTRCSLPGAITVFLLGPVGVLPERQGAGTGSRMIREAISHVGTLQAGGMLVLGDPGYYSRFGFAMERNVIPPYDLPDEWAGAWQSIIFHGETQPTGRLEVPALWQSKALWLP